MGNNVSTQFFSNCENMNLQNIVDINGIINCAIELEGIKSNSSSPSDLVKFKFPSNSHYNGEIIKGGFQKIFISNFDNSEEKKDSIYNLIDKYTKNNIKDSINILSYEYYIYMEKIRNLLQQNVTPHLIKVLGGIRETSYTNMFKYINDKALDKSLTNINLLINFVDNFIKMVYSLKNRESLTKNTLSSFNVSERNHYNYMSLLNKMNQVKYGFILTEYNQISEIKYLNDFLNMSIGDTITFNNYLAILSEVLLKGTSTDKDIAIYYLYIFYFQIVSACYALYLSGINHNDLHSGNILLKRIETVNYQYYIDNKKWTIHTQFTAIIYDFDRSYCETYDNDLNKNFRNNMNINKLYKEKDIVKIFYYLYRITSNRIDPYYLKIQNNIFSDLAKPLKETEIRNFYNITTNKNRGPDIQKEYIELYIEPSDLKNVDEPVNILDKLYKHIEKENEILLKIYNKKSNIYICNKDSFNKFNLILNNNLDVLKKYEETECLKISQNENNKTKSECNEKIKTVEEENNKIKSEYNEKIKTVEEQLTVNCNNKCNETIKTVQEQLTVNCNNKCNETIKIIQDKNAIVENNYKNEMKILKNEIEKLKSMLSMQD